MRKSPSIAALAHALVKAQAKMPMAAMNSTNPHFKSKYADLQAIWDAASKPLADNGLAVSQWPNSMESGQPCLTTLLVHESGEWIEADYPLISDRQNAQGFGSALTYAKRYALASILGIVADEDDDGNAASPKPQKPQPLQTYMSNDEDPDGQAKNWVDQQIVIIKAAKAIPELTAWLDKVAADK